MSQPASKKARVDDGASTLSVFDKHQTATLQTIGELAAFLNAVVDMDRTSFPLFPQDIQALYRSKQFSKTFLVKERNYFHRLVGKDRLIPFRFEELLCKGLRLFLFDVEMHGKAKQIPVYASKFMPRDFGMDIFLSKHFSKDIVDFIMCRSTRQPLPKAINDYLNKIETHELNWFNLLMYFCCANWLQRNEKANLGSRHITRQFCSNLRNKANTSNFDW